MRHVISLAEMGLDRVSRVIAAARVLKSEGWAEDRRFEGRVLGMVFFNPSLRTRTSCESAMARFGGHAINLNIGKDTWSLELRDGQVMDGACAEHVREAGPVLSRYCDALGIRTFAGLEDADRDATDPMIRAFAAHAEVPVINLESAMFHPCQGLADRMTIEEKLGEARGRRFVLTWAPHIKALPMAVPHSALMAAASAGMEVTIARPEGYDVQPSVMARAQAWCEAAGTTLSVTDAQVDACRSADVVYVKSWGAAGLYGQPVKQRADFERYADWMVGPDHLGEGGAIVMHCLPVRRNVVMAEAVLDGPGSVVVDQAENRFWTQAAVLTDVWGGPRLADD